jgi:hypothetical protein
MAYFIHFHQLCKVCKEPRVDRQRFDAAIKQCITSISKQGTKWPEYKLYEFLQQKLDDDEIPTATDMAEWCADLGVMLSKTLARPEPLSESSRNFERYVLDKLYILVTA